jgi:hypothetical protein
VLPHVEILATDKLQSKVAAEWCGLKQQWTRSRQQSLYNKI